MTYAWTYTPEADVDAGTSCTFANPQQPLPASPAPITALFTLTLTVDDGFNQPVSDTSALTLNNRAPVVTLTAPADGSTFAVGEIVDLAPPSLIAPATIPIPVKVDWGDGVITNGAIAMVSARLPMSILRLVVTHSPSTLRTMTFAPAGDSVMVTSRVAAPKAHPPLTLAALIPAMKVRRQPDWFGLRSRWNALTYSWTYSADASGRSGHTCCLWILQP